MTIRFLTLAVLATLVAPLATAQETLYKQPDGFEDADGRTDIPTTEGWIYSENFTVAANDGNDGYLADDFTVPVNETWTVDEIAILAFYRNGTDDAIVPATSFNVIVWDHDSAAGTPGTTRLLDLANVTPSSDNTGGVEGTAGVIEFTLPTALQLEAGTYWVTVQANMSTETLGEDTRFFWGGVTALNGETLQWWNYGGLLTDAAPCNAGWGDNFPDCRNATSQQDPGVYLRLEGSRVVASEEAAESRTVAILPTRPNPAAASTVVPFELREPADVRLAVYDVLGREVALLVDRAYAAGEHTARLDASALAPGTYVVRLTASADVVLRTIAVAR